MLCLELGSLFRYSKSMFFRQRSTQAEYFDLLERPSEVAKGYRELGRANRLFQFSRPFQILLPRLLGLKSCRKLSILDLGAGDGSLGRQLTEWAAQRGWLWRVTNLDVNLAALQISQGLSNVLASALRLPFQDNSFDVVLASQMTHHLTPDAEVLQHFREAWRVARLGLLVSDLHRSLALYGVIWFGTRLLGLSSDMRSDGLLSVRRGFRVKEWEELAQKAEITQARVSVYCGTRLILQARKLE
jgi:2-polyprenyl-3-methyl-5-hydroxy-6-metoxy-1,4-benzoquinol methylase